MRRKDFFFRLLAGSFFIPALLWLMLFCEERRDLEKAAIVVLTILLLAAFLAWAREACQKRQFEGETLLKNMLAASPSGVVVLKDDKVIWLNRKAGDIVRLRAGDSPETCRKMCWGLVSLH